MFNYYYDRINNWPHIIQLLENSLDQAKMVCGLTSSLAYHPDTAHLLKSLDIHNHLILATYHRVAAIGAAKKLKDGYNQPAVLQTITSSILNTESQDKNVIDNLNKMFSEIPPEEKTAIHDIIQWQEQAELYFQKAKVAIQKMGVSLSHDNRLDK